jgi:hypothetical protein
VRATSTTTPGGVGLAAGHGVLLRTDHAALSWLHSFADLPRPVSLLLCDALAEMALLTRSEPVPRPPAVDPGGPAQALAAMAQRLGDVLTQSGDVATALALARIIRHLLEAEQILRRPQTRPALPG